MTTSGRPQPSLDRRSFLRAAAVFGAGLAAARPARALGPMIGRLGEGGARTSRLAASDGLTLVHTDLHNHTLISGDAAGDPYTALAQMRARGIDVACLTEHAISGKDHGEITCPGHQQGGCHTVEGINETDWALMAEIADAAYDPGAPDPFVAFRGFEYSTPTVGHINVYFTQEFTDALHEHAFFTPPAAAEIDRVAPVPSEIVDNFEQLPDVATMRFFYEWLSSEPGREIFGGGADGIGCFNHPGAFGNFEDFVYHAGAAQRIVSFEALNEDRDFFWYGHDEGMPNQVNACLNAGWRVGFTGVSDEHGTEFGREGMARGGLWVSEVTRAGVRAALEARRSFATMEQGLRLDATANGVPMGSAIAHDDGVLQIEIDTDAGPLLNGTTLLAEVLRPGATFPELLATEPFTLGSVAQLEVSASRDDGDWLFVRITDPARPADARATGALAGHGGVVAYASPWFMDPA